MPRELKNLWKMKEVIPIVISTLGTIAKRIATGTGGLGNEKTSGHYPNYSKFVIGQNTEKSPEDLRRLAVTLTPMENHQLTLM